MRLSRSLALAASAAGLIVLSLPASATPLPPERPVSTPLPPKRPARFEQRATRAAPHRAKPENRHLSHEVAQRVAMVSPRPLFGWPALVIEARKYIGTNPTDRKKLWCATFMNFILHKLGYTGTNSDAAKSFVYYGHRISEPRVGAIAVLRRGKRGGHVGVVSGIDPHGDPIIISGNHNNRVGVGIYPRSRVIAYVMPTEMRSAPAVAVAARGGAARAGVQHGIDSPIAELVAAIRAGQERQAAREAAREAHAAARPATPPPPHRTVQQLPDREAVNHRLPFALAELFGRAGGAQAGRPVAR